MNNKLMKRRVNILSVLLVTILLSSFVLINITAEETPSTDLTQEEQDVLDAIQNISDAGTNFITDVSKSAWPELKDTIKNPQEIPGKLYNWTTSKLFFITGTTDKYGRSITFYRNNHISPIILLIIIFICTFIGFVMGFLGVVGGEYFGGVTRKKLVMGSSLGLLVGIAISLFINFANFTLILNSSFWKNIVFLLIVLGMMTLLFLVMSFIAKKNFQNQYQPGDLFGPDFCPSARENFKIMLKLKYPIIISFSILYILFQSIPILNIGLYLITLEFLGYNNPLFTWAIRPLLIAFLLFFSKDIIYYFAKKYAKDKKFKDALEKKAIEEMNKASLGA